MAAAAAPSPPVEGRLQQKLRKLGEQATDALRASYASQVRAPRASLEASAQSAARTAASVEQSAAQTGAVAADLRALAASLSTLRDDEESLGNNVSLWPS